MQLTQYKEEEIEESRLLRALELIEKESVNKTLTLGELVNLLGTMGHGVLILLLCLFFLQPIPLPGISTPIGLIIVLSSTAQFLNRPPWIPASLRHHKIPPKALRKIVGIARKIWARLERLMHPRLLFLTRSDVFRFINLILIIASAFFLALPLPIPFTNTIPALVILSIVFAQLEDDGFLVLAGYFFTFLMLVFFSSVSAGVWAFAQRPWPSPF